MVACAARCEPTICPRVAASKEPIMLRGEKRQDATQTQCSYCRNPSSCRSRHERPKHLNRALSRGTLATPRSKLRRRRNANIQSYGTKDTYNLGRPCPLPKLNKKTPCYKIKKIQQTNAHKPEPFPVSITTGQSRMWCDQLRPTKTQRVTGYAPNLGKGIGRKAFRRNVKHQKIHIMYRTYFTQPGVIPVLQAVLPPPPLPPKSTHAKNDFVLKRLPIENRLLVGGSRAKTATTTKPPPRTKHTAANYSPPT